MKCPVCAASQRRRDGMRCSGCSYSFIFDPRVDGVADARFTSLINKVSGNGSRVFTARQLYGAWAAPRPQRLILGVIVAGGVVAVTFGWPWLALPFAVIALLVLLPTRAPRLGIFETQLAKWRSLGGRVDGLIEVPSLRTPPPQWAEPDIYAYGVERIVVVEHELYVDLLVKNDFHIENRALVVAESGYPPYLQPVVARCLADNPALPIVLLHDATTAGASMAERVARSFPGRHIVDAGLSAAQVKSSRTLRRFAPGVPLDVLPWKSLASAVAPAVVAGVAIAAVPDTFGDGDSDFG